MILFIEPAGEQDAPKAGDIYAFGVRGYEALDLIITDIQPGQNLSAVLTCVEHSPEIFGVDDDNFVLPKFENKITPVSGAMDSGIVNPDNWRSFYVYHDDDDEPERPAGSGQGGGWHYAQTFRSVWQSAKTAASIESGEWGAPVRIRAGRGNEDVIPVWLSLSPQSVPLETDGEGVILAGLLPFSSQARLFRWNSRIEQGVSYSLENAPEGVSIDADGLVTVAAGAALNDANNFTVQAEYGNSLYSAVLLITVKTNSSAPRYLGTVETMLVSAQAVIVKGPVMGQVRALQGDFVFAPAALGGFLAGSVFQWTGVAWEFRPATGHTDLYARCYKDGLDAPGLAGNTEWFGAAIIRELIAQRAFIEELQAQVITLSQGGAIQSGNFDPGLPAGQRQGFRIKADGDAEFNNSFFRGHINSSSGFIKNMTGENLNIIGGRIKVGPLEAEEVGNLPAMSFPSTTTIGSLFDQLASRYGADPNACGWVGFPLYNGGICSWDVTGISFYREQNGLITYFSVIATDGLGRFISSNPGGVNNAQIGHLLVIHGGGGAKLALSGLPPFAGTPGEVYKMPNPASPGDFTLCIKG